MGNLTSCSALTNPMMKGTRAARVILPGGEVRKFRQPVKAAELMLESPNHFLVDFKALAMGKRFSALPADEDLEMGNVYVMFPMKRLNSVVTAADMAGVLVAADTTARWFSCGKVKPEMLATRVPPPTTVEGDSDGVEGYRTDRRSRLGSEDIEGFKDMEFRFKLASSKSRKPLLDTITEEPIFSR